ncbi:hypothetical protein GCM10019017_77450 [Streptomyces showdoensis]
MHLDRVMTLLVRGRPVIFTEADRCAAGVAWFSAPAGPGTPVRRGKVHPPVPLAMLTFSIPFIMVFPELPSEATARTGHVSGGRLHPWRKDLVVQQPERLRAPLLPVGAVFGI